MNAVKIAALVVLVWPALSTSARAAVLQASSFDPCPAVAGIDFVFVPGGVVTMGNEEAYYEDEKPTTKVEIRPFCLSAAPLSPSDVARLSRLSPETRGSLEVFDDASAQSALNLLGFDVGSVDGEWGKRSKAGLAAFQRRFELLDSGGELTAEAMSALQKRVSIPIPSKPRDYRFSWAETRVVLAGLSALSGRGIRLPTEAEWEFAARGGLSGQSLPWTLPWTTSGSAGNSISKDQLERLEEYSCGWDDPFGSPRPPPASPPNGYGVRDLLVDWEWTSTLYAPYPYDEADGRQSQDASAGHRALRGGGGSQERCEFTVSQRGYGAIASRYRIRVAVAPVPKPSQ